MSARERKVKNKSPKNGKEKVEEKRSLKEFSIRRFLGRLVFIPILLTVIYYYFEKSREITFVSVNEQVHRRSFQVPCSDEYDKEKERLKNCLPKICGRVVTDVLIEPHEIEQLLNIAKKGFVYGRSDGGASVLDVHTGALSKGNAFINISLIKEGTEIFTSDDLKLFRNVKNKIQHMISEEFGILPHQLYLTHPTFFSEITERPAKTIHDEYWHPHNDKDNYKSFHYTSLVYLSDYEEDFTGGRFFFIDKNANHTVEPKAGRVSMFTSASENIHFIEKVTGGVRYALTIPFTCNEAFSIKFSTIGKNYNLL